jgi:hypothetical protein
MHGEMAGNLVCVDVLTISREEGKPRRLIRVITTRVWGRSQWESGRLFSWNHESNGSKIAAGVGDEEGDRL